MKLRSFRRLWIETISSLKRNRVMSLASVGTVAVALLVLGSFMVFAGNVDHMVKDLEGQVEITAYFDEEASDLQVTEGTVLAAETNNVGEVMFICQEEALVMLHEQFGEDSDLLEAVEGANPLRHSMQIKLVNQEKIEETAQEIKNIDGIAEVQYKSEVVERLLGFTRMIRTFGMAVALFLVFLTVFMISNTIKLTVFARRREIGIMKLVGAGDWFIRGPFVLEGMILGLGGALISILIIYFGYPALVRSLTQTLPFLPLVEGDGFVEEICRVLLGAGVVIGALGSFISIRRYLQV